MPSLGDYEPMKFGPSTNEHSAVAEVCIYDTIPMTMETAMFKHKEEVNTKEWTIYSDPPFDPLIPKTCPVSISNLGTHVASYHSESNTQFSKEFQVLYLIVTQLNCFVNQQLHNGEESSWSVASSEKNKPFNRFQNIVPCG